MTLDGIYVDDLDVRASEDGFIEASITGVIADLEVQQVQLSTVYAKRIYMIDAVTRPRLHLK